MEEQNNQNFENQEPELETKEVKPNPKKPIPKMAIIIGAIAVVVVAIAVALIILLGGKLRAPLCSICFLERGTENTIAKIDDAAAVARLFSQVLLPKEPIMADRLLSLLDHLIVATPLYLLHCNMQQEAAVIAHDGMCKGERI